MTEILAIRTDPSVSWMWTRNGSPPIKQLNVFQSGDTYVYIDGVSRQGSVLVKGGFRIRQEEMDKLAVAWLQSRNLLDSNSDGRDILELAEKRRQWQGKSVKIMYGPYASQTGRIEDYILSINNGHPLWVRLDDPGSVHHISCPLDQVEVIY